MSGAPPDAGGQVLTAGLETRLAALPCWRGPIAIEPLAGGMTNRNVLVRCAGERFVARIGAASSPHPIDAAAREASMRAAADAGLSPAFVHGEPGLVVTAYVDGHSLAAEDLARPSYLPRIVDLLLRCRDVMPQLYHGPAVDRSPRALLQHYRDRIESRPNPWQVPARRHYQAIDRTLSALAEAAPGFAHNDIHAGNIVDDGRRLWLIDWDYAGCGLPLFDLGSLAVNGGFAPSTREEAWRLWRGAAPDHEYSPYLFTVSSAAAALRDLFWGYAEAAFGPRMAQQDIDISSYILENERRVACLTGI